MKKILYFPLILLLFASCSGNAIFYTLENEEKVRDSNNFKASTPVDRIVLFSSGGSDYYITHGRKLWYSLAGTEQNPWSSISLPDGYSQHVTVPSIAVFGSRLYAVLSDYDNDSATTLGFIDTPEGVIAESIKYNRFNKSGDDFNFYELGLFPVNSVNSGLYISRVNRSWNTQSSNSSSVESSEVFYFPPGDYPSSLDDNTHRVTLAGLTGAFVVKDMVSDGTDTYLILNRTGSGVDSYKSGMLFKASNSDPDYFEEVSMSASYAYNRLYYSQAHSTLFLSTRSDSDKHPILYKTGSGSWGGIEGPDDVQFSSFVDISSIRANTILAGTKADVISGSQTYYSGDGYYEINLNDINNPDVQGNTFTLTTNYNSTDLNNATINDFLFDTSRNKIYATTSENGLWMNKFSSADDARIWYQE